MFTLKAKNFADILSRNISLADAKLYQLEHKVIPKDIKFQINGKEVNYSVLHQDDKDATAKDCYPFIAHVRGERKKLINLNDEGDFSVDDALDHINEDCNAIHSFFLLFSLRHKWNKEINFWTY